jgi:hypothetical protein
MGYYSHLSGEVTFTPGFDAKGTKFDPSNVGDSCVAITTTGTPDTVALVDGKVTVVPGTLTSTIASAYEDSIKAYSLEGDFAEAVALAVANGATTFEGAIYVSGEEDDDRWRLRVENGKGIDERPELVWPNGDRGWG